MPVSRCRRISPRSTPPRAPRCRHEQKGTGHAVRTALDELSDSGVALDGTVIVVCGDTPLLTGETLRLLRTRMRRTAMR